MSRPRVLLLSAAALLCALPSLAAAQVTATGTVDWSSFGHFAPTSGEVVFFQDPFSGGSERITAGLAIAGRTGSYSIQLTPGAFYLVTAVLTDCDTDPATCGTTGHAGTRVRRSLTSFQAPASGTATVDPLAFDATSEPRPVCGAIDTFGILRSFEARGHSSFSSNDDDSTSGVFSWIRVTPPQSHYCAATDSVSPPPFLNLEWSITFDQTQLPTCPFELQYGTTELLYPDGPDPLTHNIEIPLPPPAGELVGTFSVDGFANDYARISAFTFAPAYLFDCISFTSSFFVSGDAGPLAYDFKPALPGTWGVDGYAEKSYPTDDGLATILVNTVSEPADRLAYSIQVDVPPGGSVTPPLSFAPAVLRGKLSLDATRLGDPITHFHFPQLIALTSHDDFYSTFFGAAFFGVNVNGAYLPLPMRQGVSYVLYPDPRASPFYLSNYGAAGASGVQVAYFTQTDEWIGDSQYIAATMPTYAGSEPTIVGGSPSVWLGATAAGPHAAIDLPPMDYRVATATLNPVSSGVYAQWFRPGYVERSVPGGKQYTAFSYGEAFRFGGDQVRPAVVKAPPAKYDSGSVLSFDADFNFFLEPVTLDLEPDDALTRDFGAPLLTDVKPTIEDHADDEERHGRRCRAHAAGHVTGTVRSNDASVTRITVTVNGVAALVASDGSFSANVTPGTAPLTIVARDNLGRTTTLLRYYTLVKGLLGVCAGADLVSEGQDVRAVAGGFTPFSVPLPTNAFKRSKPVPLAVAGTLGGALVTDGNAKAPRLVSLIRAGDAVPLSAIEPSYDVTSDSGLLFRYSPKDGQWIYNMKISHLTPGTYVVRIQFWDERILEAAMVLM